MAPVLQSLADPVRGTALFAVLLWALACAALLRAWPAARVLWPLAWAACAVHVAVAFDVVHGWSHAAAFRHTAETGGVGEGVFVNYAVLLVWGVDAAWLMVKPEEYRRRPRWVGRTVHGFLAFVVFNATVVFAEGLTRWIGLILFALPIACRVRR